MDTCPSTVVSQMDTKIKFFVPPCDYLYDLLVHKIWDETKIWDSLQLNLPTELSYAQEKLGLTHLDGLDLKEFFFMLDFFGISILSFSQVLRRKLLVLLLPLTIFLLSLLNSFLSSILLDSERIYAIHLYVWSFCRLVLSFYHICVL